MKTERVAYSLRYINGRNPWMVEYCGTNVRPTMHRTLKKALELLDVPMTQPVVAEIFVRAVVKQEEITSIYLMILASETMGDPQPVPVAPIKAKTRAFPSNNELQVLRNEVFSALKVPGIILG